MVSNNKINIFVNNKEYNIFDNKKLNKVETVNNIFELIPYLMYNYNVKFNLTLT